MIKNIIKLSALCWFLAGCDDGTENNNPLADVTICGDSEAQTMPQSFKQDNIAIIKSQPANVGGIYYLQEILSDLEIFPGLRSVKRLDCEWNVALEYTVEDNQALLDFVEHPSGELSLIIISEGNYILRRIDKDGALLGGIQIEDFPAPVNTGDVADLSASGEDILLAARSNDLSVKLYRYEYTHAANFTYQWDTLIEPVTSPSGWTMVGGSYDTFEQLAQPYKVSLTTDSKGNAYIAVAGLTALIFNHNEHFSENLEPNLHSDERMNNWPQLDSIVSKVSASGERVYSVTVGSTYPDEVYGIKVIDDSVYIFGRSTRQAGNFWDGFISKLKASSGEIEYATLLDIQSGDIIYDLAELASGNLLAVGATNWTQNTQGYSVSENSEKLAALLDVNGQFIERLEITNGARHNQLRSVTSLDNDRLLMSGFENGPGTHSGDADKTLVRADGFIQTFVSP